MTWGSVGALAGFVLLAVPAIIHLLGRDPAKRRAFPSLRFIPASRLLPTRWSRIHDPLLLVVRCLVLAGAVLALARPQRAATSMTPREAERLVRVVVLDTASPAFRSSPGSALARARQALDSAAIGLLVQSDDPVRELDGAASWLSGESGRRELVVLSDFAVERFPADVAALVPSALGFVPVRLSVEARGSSAPDASSAGGAGEDPVSLIMSADARARRDAILAGVASGRVTAGRSAIGSVAVVALDDANSEERTKLLQGARALHTRSLLRIAMALRAGAFARPLTGVVPSGRNHPTPDATVLARTRSGAVAVWAVEDSVATGPRLVLVSEFPSGSPEVVEIVAAAREAATVPPEARSAGAHPDDALRSWTRASGPAVVVASAPDADGGGATARVLWGAVLLLLLLEWVVRERFTAKRAMEGDVVG